MLVSMCYYNKLVQWLELWTNQLFSFNYELNFNRVAAKGL